MTEITRFRGDTKRITYSVKDSNGAAVNIASWALVLTVSTEQNPTTTAGQQAQISATISNAASGELYFLGADLGALDVGGYWFDIQATDANGETETLDHDKITIVQDITK